MLTTTLDPSWNTLALEPAYLPLLQESLIYLASHVPAHDAVTVGDTVDLERHARGLPGYTQTAAALSRGTVTTVRAPSGDRRTLAPGEGFARVDEVGFHEAHVGGGGDRSLVIAVNAAPPESRTAPMDVEAFTAGLVTAAPRTAGAGDAGSSTSVLIQSAWWFLLLACALLLALETLFSNRLSRREQPA